jgi:hypothetical protein
MVAQILTFHIERLQKSSRDISISKWGTKEVDHVITATVRELQEELRVFMFNSR